MYVGDPAVWGKTAPFFFFFQAEDGIRDADVTGVQTCALPISARRARETPRAGWDRTPAVSPRTPLPRPPSRRSATARGPGRRRRGSRPRRSPTEIGRASCRERV